MLFSQHIPHAHSPDDPKFINSEVREDLDTAPNNVLKDQDGSSIVAQDGVLKAQAATIVWSRKALILVYALIFLIFWVNSLQQQTSNNLIVYVTSDFTKAYLIPTVGIVSTLVAGVIKLPVAKLMDIFGRVQGYLLMLVCACLGLILMAACANIETYAAAQVFYWVGVVSNSLHRDKGIKDTFTSIANEEQTRKTCIITDTFFILR